ncbi:MAG: protoporphyrinogen oxidase [Porphyromonadaceae bacterium CG2_30_38_12]|nr:MAG: protoporphyrinogen oxidase [Porphyromonadaceae bacterium CG2_30_38_12]
MENIEKEIVIIGAGLTGLTLAFYLRKRGKNVLILEKNERTGGVINTVTEKGFTYETGPSTGVLSSLEIVELFEDLVQQCSLQVAAKGANKRYIWKKTKWEALPSGLLSAVRTPLFTLKDKLRILGELFRKAGGTPNESVADLVVRRLGKSFLDYAVDPFLSGVYAGDPSQLITRHALPKLYALEQNYGGFVRGTIAKQKEAKTDPQRAQHKKVTRQVFSVVDGLKKLTETLHEQIGNANILTNCKDLSIQPTASGFSIQFRQNSDDVKSILASKVITTIGGYALADVIPFADASDLKHFAETTYSPVIQIAVGYNHWSGIKLDAFGGLISSKDKRSVLGVLFPSAIFPYRAPEGGALLSVFMGGTKRKDLLLLPDTEIEKLVKAELKILMKVDAEPDLLRIHRYQHAIAQYDVKTDDRLKSISNIEKKYPGLIIAGSIRDGIGMSDRVKQAKILAKELMMT